MARVFSKKPGSVRKPGGIELSLNLPETRFAPIPGPFVQRPLRGTPCWLGATGIVLLRFSGRTTTVRGGGLL